MSEGEGFRSVLYVNPPLDCHHTFSVVVAAQYVDGGQDHHPIGWLATYLACPHCGATTKVEMGA